MNKKYIKMVLIFIINLSIITIIPLDAQVNQAQTSTIEGNVTSTIKPQGTSIEAQNETSNSKDSSKTTSAGNVTSTIKPQGTSIDTAN